MKLSVTDPKEMQIHGLTHKEEQKEKNNQKNSFESVLMRWMKLEPIIQSEISQKDKDHYTLLTHIYGI